MNTTTILILFALIVTCRADAGNTPTAQILNSGFVAGFPPGTSTASGKTLYFEASSLVKVDGTYWVANDKPIPSHCPLIAIQSKAFMSGASDPALASPVDSAAFEKSEKIESMALGHDFNFASADFEWITDNPAEADAYNNLLRWSKKDVSHAVLLHESERAGVKSSRILRESFAAALKSPKYPSGPPYYKIEGLEQVDQVCLIFGVREVGTDYEHPEPCFVLLEVAFEKGADDLPTTSKSFKKVLEFIPKVPGSEDLRFGLSSLESDPGNKTFVATTTSEKSSAFKTAFWLFSRDKDRFTEPVLLYEADGKPLVVNHKVEGIAFESKDTILAICDDDRELTTLSTSTGTATRKPNEAAYFRIKINN